MSDLQVQGRFDRRPSFWKTPITHNSSQIIGQKRNYSEINNNNNNNDNNCNNSDCHNANLSDNPNKKRRLLTESEIEDIAKYGGFNPSNIIIAVEESDGFKWFKRAPINNQNGFNKQKYLQKYWNIKPQNNNNKNSNVLRELSKEELKNKNKNKTANDFNKEQAMQIQRAAKSRRHTAPISMLQKLINSNNKKEAELMGENVNKKKKKKKKKKKMKKVTQYKTKKEIIKKKKKIKRRIVYKKRTHTIKTKITTEFGDILIPDLPSPNLKLNNIFYSNISQPHIALNNFELSLIDSFVIPLTHVYGQSHKNSEKNNLSFITRNVLQFLLEIKKNIKHIVNCVDFEIVTIPIKPSIIAYKEMNENNKNNNESESISEQMNENSQSPSKTSEHNRLKTPFEDDKYLEDQCIFYQNELLLIDSFCENIKQEIDFTKYVHAQLQNEQYLTHIFDFDLNDLNQMGNGNHHDNNMDLNINNMNNNNNMDLDVLNDNEYIHKMASQIDKIYSEYCLEFQNIEYAQKRYENELDEREIKIEQAQKYYKYNINEEKQSNCVLNQANVNENMKNKLVFSNFIQSNKYKQLDDQNEEQHINDLRQIDGYQMEENDTLQMDIDVN